MASVDDVAAAILGRICPIDTFKLQKLAYYSQAWHLVWDEEPLFENDIEAWAAGPVVRTLYERHRGRYTVSDWSWGDASNLTLEERTTIDAVVDSYGSLTGRRLSDLTHSERPWRQARRGLGPTDRSDMTISIESLYAFYSALDHDDAGVPVSDLIEATES